ncbi:XdhC family protein [Streptomyces sparsogenes]|uniref:XshC-Cox1-family protein n=1 Tax=Streptomyces sparsogenes DSM 40356 TaxID=1331668 RepID=A0A1R1SED4_9ACTN|nr:XdhC/CoxI family protein [Streptomyces sparsogenes]OMI36650.1 XshC-Cox1-family protein [Streptomyces sparsogenes DSM 40356]
MRDVLEPLMSWWAEGKASALATVVATRHSAPRRPGASMLVGPGAEAIGSVSGGCVEGAVYDLGQEVLAGARPLRRRYGVSDADAFAVGLTCGGTLDVFVERVDSTTFPQLGEVVETVRAGRPVAVATVITGPAERLGRRLIVWPDRVAGGTGSGRLDGLLCQDARGLLEAGRTGVLRYGADGHCRGQESEESEESEAGLEVFVESFAPPPRMLVFGAVDFADAVARTGSFLGYRVTVCDARPVFATAARLPGADEIVVEWPHRYLQAEADAGRIDGRTVICVLTHDQKFDVPLLRVALRLPDVGYIGAMGSRRTHEDRWHRLTEAGLTEAELKRLSSPIGLDLGARTPEETAVSIAAEIIAVKSGGSGFRLADRTGPIHLGPGL